MSSFDEAMDYVLQNEGSFVNDGDDTAGMTNFGLSFRFLKSISSERMKYYGFIVVDDEHLVKIIEEMTPETAKLIYKGEFWDGTYFEKINNQRVANYYFDMAVHCGMATATKITQRSIHALNLKLDIIEDGVFGVKTLEEINHDGFMLIPPMRAERANYYRQIVRDNPNLSKYLNGWLNRAYK